MNYSEDDTTNSAGFYIEFQGFMKLVKFFHLLRHTSLHTGEDCLGDKFLVVFESVLETDRTSEFNSCNRHLRRFYR